MVKLIKRGARAASIAALLAMVVLLILGEAWLWFPGLLTLDAAAIIGATGSLVVLTPLKATRRHAILAVSIVCAVVIYDVVSVFGTGAMLAMAEVAVGNGPAAPTPPISGSIIAPVITASNQTSENGVWNCQLNCRSKFQCPFGPTVHNSAEHIADRNLQSSGWTKKSFIIPE